MNTKKFEPVSNIVAIQPNDIKVTINFDLLWVPENLVVNLDLH